MRKTNVFKMAYNTGIQIKENMMQLSESVREQVLQIPAHRDHGTSYLRPPGKKDQFA